MAHRTRAVRVGAVVVVLLAAAVLVVVAVRGGRPHPADGTRTPSSPQVRLPTGDDLLDGVDVARLGGDSPWTITRTDANTSGTGLTSRCQQRRFADERGYAALVRVLRGPGSPPRTAVQSVEVSRSRQHAEAAYTTTVDWYAGCRAARLQVVAAYRVAGVGDRAEVLVLRVGDRPVTTLSVAVARTGAIVTSTVTSTHGTPPATGDVVGALADGVRKLCRSGLGGSCVTSPSARPVAPPQTDGDAGRGMLAAADLPPVGTVDRPWTGTSPTSPRTNPAATACDRAAFASAGATQRRSRTFVVPQASLPAQFGLSETIGTFRSVRGAGRFLARVRTSVQGCARRDLSTKVSSELRPVRSRGTDSAQWRLASQVSAHRVVRFRVGFVRLGRSVAQVTFTPSAGADMSDHAFGGLLVRAAQRLRELG